MRLTDLQPQFLRYVVEDGRYLYRHVDDILDAQGVIFLCPKCYAANGGERGTHSVICWSRSRGVPDDASPSPGRWSLHGTGYSDLTLHGDPPGGARSILLTGTGCNWHGFVTDGEVT